MGLLVAYTNAGKAIPMKLSCLPFLTLIGYLIKKTQQVLVKTCRNNRFPYTQNPGIFSRTSYGEIIDERNNTGWRPRFTSLPTDNSYLQTDHPNIRQTHDLLSLIGANDGKHPGISDYFMRIHRNPKKPLFA